MWILLCDVKKKIVWLLWSNLSGAAASDCKSYHGPADCLIITDWSALDDWLLYSQYSYFFQTRVANRIFMNGMVDKKPN